MARSKYTLEAVADILAAIRESRLDRVGYHSGSIFGATYYTGQTKYLEFLEQISKNLSGG
ncbi:MAG: hypothetical protein F6K50_17925 [Moorea sp. SIO3I7]|uniref:hypothetical protein n=1 Tax=unclassified Moorena TaxID=2683338 RepID=UPI0013C1DE4F|nr:MULTISPECIES: hypothetical protein [unclassified Moorena]NEN97333.1 hypothetical protein [Moorena sp. SIO3I7]NEO08522.1 hypothetical protein [Moorena sp. SIO3I8]NEP25568.1 hypothetical protein [Moorena sp. SIO3I6]